MVKINKKQLNEKIDQVNDVFKRCSSDTYIRMSEDDTSITIIQHEKNGFESKLGSAMTKREADYLLSGLINGSSACAIGLMEKKNR
jgi:hypothetical protein